MDRGAYEAAISLKDVRRDALGRSLDAEHTEALLDNLEKTGWLRGVETRRAGRVAARLFDGRLIRISTCAGAGTAETWGLEWLLQFLQFLHRADG